MQVIAVAIAIVVLNVFREDAMARYRTNVINGDRNEGGCAPLTLVHCETDACMFVLLSLSVHFVLCRSRCCPK